MLTIKTTADFQKWLMKLKDPIAKASIARRIKRMEQGNFGDHKLLPATGGIFELRIDTGKGYRIYYAQEGETVYLLLKGGDKTTQDDDIKQASLLWSGIQKAM